MLINDALNAWGSLANFRHKRERQKNYTFGRQWEDRIVADGVEMTERELILREGQTPLQNNLIRRIVRNVLGVFRKRLREKIERWNDDYTDLTARNQLYEKFSRSMEEFLISGVAVFKCGCTGEREVRCEPVNPFYFFYNQDTLDAGGGDFTLAGEIHSLSLEDYCKAFVRTREEYKEAHRMFRENGGGRRKVVEVWRKEMRERRMIWNTDEGVLLIMDEHRWRCESRLHGYASRWEMEEVWRYYFLNEEGEVIREGDSPYPHKGHPYVFRAYSFLDGEINSFVSDIIDQQRYTNRLITLYDWYIHSSAKGVLLMPEGSVDADKMEYVADQWSRMNGVIVYKPQNDGTEPHQIMGGTQNIAITDLLNIQLKMLEDVSGVNGALQGNLATNSMSGTLYSQQTENSIMALADILDSFCAFVSDVMEKASQLFDSSFVKDAK
ncbi:MAG: hypothetical protein K2H46_06855 [Muribaculaceae bacterium]|nr:hypothetical protein [Muribaculaceae bacterium]